MSLQANDTIAASQVLQRPNYFKRRVGRVYHAHPLFGRPAPVTKTKNYAKKAGILFERKVIRALDQVLPLMLPHLTIKFVGQHDRGYAIPDTIAFSFDLSHITVIEIKTSHSSDAYVQTTNFYVPILRKAFPGKSISVMEICKNFHRGVQIPIEAHPIKPSEIATAVELKVPRYYIVPWSGRVAL